MPAGILVYHVLAGMSLGPHGGAAHAPGTGGLADSVNMSMLFHIWMVALGIMVCHELLAGAARRPVVLAICGLAMMAGPAAAMRYGAISGGMTALGLVAYSGLAVWLSPLWGLAEGRSIGRRPVRLAVIGAAGVFAVLLAGMAPMAAIVSLGVAGAVLCLCGVRFSGRRVALLIPGAILLAVGAAGAYSWGAWPPLPAMSPGLAGAGEEAFAHLSGGDAGIYILWGMVGWVGAVWLAAGLLAAIVFVLIRSAGSSAADVGRAAVWAVASVLAVCAMLTGGGAEHPGSDVGRCGDAGAAASGDGPTIAADARRCSGAGLGGLADDACLGSTYRNGWLGRSRVGLRRYAASRFGRVLRHTDLRVDGRRKEVVVGTGSHRPLPHWQAGRQKCFRAGSRRGPRVLVTGLGTLRAARSRLFCISCAWGRGYVNPTWPRDARSASEPRRQPRRLLGQRGRRQIALERRVLSERAIQRVSDQRQSPTYARHSRPIALGERVLARQQESEEVLWQRK